MGHFVKPCFNSFELQRLDQTLFQICIFYVSLIQIVNGALQNTLFQNGVFKISLPLGSIAQVNIEFLKGENPELLAARQSL